MISGTRKILFSIALILILLAGSAWAGQVLPALGGTTGGGTGALDAIYAGGDAPKYSALATGDICIVSDPSTRLTSFYMFYIDDDAQSESAPFVILPDEQSPGVAYSGNGAWLMMSLSQEQVSTPKKEDTAGELFLYEADGTGTDNIGLLGPSSMGDDTSYRGEFSGAGPVAAGAIQMWAASSSGTGAPDDPLVHLLSWAYLDDTAGDGDTGSLWSTDRILQEFASIRATIGVNAPDVLAKMTDAVDGGIAITTASGTALLNDTALTYNTSTNTLSVENITYTGDLVCEANSTGPQTAVLAEDLSNTPVGEGAYTFTLSAPADITTSYTWTLPGTAAGGANYLINVDADGTMGYTDPATLGGGGTLTTLEEANSGVGDADIVTIDFGAGFDLTEDPNTEINVALDLTEYTGAVGSTSGEITNIYMGDAAVLYMGADQDVSLTHVADTGITLNAAMQFQFRDSAIYIASLNDGYLDIEADTAIRMLGPVDMGANALDCDSNTVTLSTVSGAIDAGGATSLEIPNSDDPDVDAAGEISWDTDGWMRAYDGSAQVAIARKLEEIHVTVVAPQDLEDAERDAFWIWSNESGMSFIVTGWKAWSKDDDTTLNIEEIDADGANNATVDAVEIATNGTGCFYASDSTITGATIENGHILVLDFDDSDDPDLVKITIYGYYAADVN